MANDNYFLKQKLRKPKLQEVAFYNNLQKVFPSQSREKEEESTHLISYGVMEECCDAKLIKYQKFLNFIHSCFKLLYFPWTFLDADVDLLTDSLPFSALSFKDLKSSPIKVILNSSSSASITSFFSAFLNKRIKQNTFVSSAVQFCAVFLCIIFTTSISYIHFKSVSCLEVIAWMTQIVNKLRLSI